MKKIISTEKGAVLKFRVSGNAAVGGGMYVIDNNGILVDDAHAELMEDRLGGQVALSEPVEADIKADQAAQAKALEDAKLVEGAACTTDDGHEGTLQKDADGNLVCTVPTE